MAVHLKKKKKVRRSYDQLFLDKLNELAAGSEKPVGNKTLKEALGWDKPLYDRIKKNLHGKRSIDIGKGFGGSVALIKSQEMKGLNLFLSYSHLDENVEIELLKHLEPLRRLGLIITWHDRKIMAGEEWDKVISTNLEKADIILLLVSIDFINSSYCYDIELKKSLDRHEAKEARVIPVIIRSCMWQDTPFAKLQALPKDAKAVSLWSDQDAALLNIAEGIRKVAKELIESR